MNRFVAGGVVLGFAATTAVFLAAPASAQVPVEWDLTELDWDAVNVDHTPLEGNISPDAVAPGGEVTVTGECNLQQISDPSHAHEVRWALVEPDEFPGWEGLPEGLSFTAVEEGRVDVPGLDAEDPFNWEFTFDAPAEAGDYSIVAICAPIDLAAYPHCWIGTYGADDLTFEVDEELPPVEEAPKPTPAAVPVAGRPSFTG